MWRFMILTINHRSKIGLEKWDLKSQHKSKEELMKCGSKSLKVKILFKKKRKSRNRRRKMNLKLDFDKKNQTLFQKVKIIILIRIHFRGECKEKK